MTASAAPRWLTVEHVLHIHQEVIKSTGGSAGLRDEGLLESALARAENYHAYGEHDIFLLAATYAEGIARNHAFVDGNKRTAHTTADLFLRFNGFLLAAEVALEHTSLFENLAAGKVGREDLAEFYRHHTQPVEAFRKNKIS